MTPAISNIAWSTDALPDALALLSDRRIQGLEIAPGLLFAHADDSFDPPYESVTQMREAISTAGLRLVSMQGLLHGSNGASLFGDLDERRAFEQQMIRSIVLADRLGIPNLVLGAPRSRRIPSHMSREQAEETALAVFGRLACRAAEAGTVIAFEHCPAAYGTNFLTTFAEASAFVCKAAHPALAVNLDIGALRISGEGFPTDGVELINHVHISEPWLAPAPPSAASVEQILGALRTANYSKSVSIEMRPHPTGLDGVAKCLGLFAEAWSSANIGGTFGQPRARH